MKSYDDICCWLMTAAHYRLLRPTTASRPSNPLNPCPLAPQIRLCWPLCAFINYIYLLAYLLFSWMWSFVCLTVSVVTQTLRGGMNAIDVILHVLTMPAVAAEVHFHYISSFCVFCLSCADWGSMVIRPRCMHGHSLLSMMWHGLCVCLLITTESTTKKDEPMKMQLGVWTLVVPGNHARIPTGEGAILGGAPAMWPFFKILWPLLSNFRVSTFSIATVISTFWCVIYPYFWLSCFKCCMNTVTAVRITSFVLWFWIFPVYTYQRQCFVENAMIRQIVGSF